MALKITMILVKSEYFDERSKIQAEKKSSFSRKKGTISN